VTWWGGAAALAALFGAVWWLRRRYLVVAILGRSMLPTYADRDRVLVRRRKAGRPVQAGDVVVADLTPRLVPGAGGSSGAPLNAIRFADRVVKRVAAVPGDPVPAGIAVPDVRVPAGQLVLLGDNPAESADSRQYGYVPENEVIGMVLRHLRARPWAAEARAGDVATWRRS
jgi:signal peptidase I